MQIENTRKQSFLIILIVMLTDWTFLLGGILFWNFQNLKKSTRQLAENRDVEIHGRQYTLINPAYMTRQVYEVAQASSFVQGHITSLNPISPKNAPDTWEQKALRRDG